MKLLLLTFLSASLFSHAGWSDEVIRPNTKVGSIEIGGLTRENAQMKLRVWWETERKEPIKLTSEKLKTQPDRRSATNWGLSLNDQKCIDSLPPEAFVDSGDSVAMDPLQQTKPITVDLVFDYDSAKLVTLTKFIKTQQPPATGGSAQLVKGRLMIKSTTQVEYFVKEEDMRKAVLDAFWQPDRTGLLPIQEKTTKLAADPNGIPVDEVSTFRTHYPVGQVDRNVNLGLASKKIDGTVLMPGETFSFNKIVGKRTEAAGFHEAGIYVNGRHDTGIGGGCCQVSTTLYNAALLADLKIVERSNHSLPVAYVPQGRDATVSWGSYDMQFQNNKSYPIAIARSAFGKGYLGFTIYGKKDDVVVKIFSKKLKTWDHPVQYEVDKSLRTGQREVKEKGAMGSSAQAWREVYVQGKLVRRDDLGVSTYRGGPRIIAVGPGTPIARSGKIAGMGKRKIARRPSVQAPTVTVSPGGSPATTIVPVRRGG